MANTEKVSKPAEEQIAKTGHESVSYRDAREVRQTSIEVIKSPEEFQYRQNGELVVRPAKRITGLIAIKGEDGSTKRKLVAFIVPNAGVGFLPASFASPQNAIVTEEFDTVRDRWFTRSVEFANAVKPTIAINDLEIAKALMK